MANDSPIWRLLKLNMPEKWTILVGIISSMVQGALLPLYAVLFGEFLAVLAEPDKEIAQKEANEFALWFVGLGVAAGISMFLLMYLFTLAGKREELVIIWEAWGK
jgi:ATP-binding cassette subfamily B (MDR/TAP) protein 1